MEFKHKELLNEFNRQVQSGEYEKGDKLEGQVMINQIKLILFLKISNMINLIL